MKLTQLYKEVKINNPRSHFIVTSKGKEAQKDFNDLLRIINKLKVSELIHEDIVYSSYEIITWLQMLDIYSDNEGEGIIKMNEKNSIEQFINGSKNIIGYDKEEAQEHIKIFQKYGWIKII